MFKFVAVFALVAVAVADPDPALLLSAPYIQPYSAYSTLVSPGSTSISSSSSSVIHPSPLTYASQLHFLKKRSADPQFLATTYNSPLDIFPTSYQYSPSASIISTPTLYSNPWATVHSTAHLIKKRSAQLLTTPYIAPTTYISNPAVSPLISSSYIQTPYFGAQLPLVNTHFIKKRSAEATPEPAADPQFIAPNFYTPSSYITPYAANPLWNNYWSAAPLATTHFIKKRSAEAKPEPAADPQFAFNVPSFYSGSPLYPSIPATTLINSAPIYSANPFLYSSFIKK